MVTCCWRATTNLGRATNRAGAIGCGASHLRLKAACELILSPIHKSPTHLSVLRGMRRAAASPAGSRRPPSHECRFKRLTNTPLGATRILADNICYIEKTYIPDFLCYGRIIVEIKAVAELTAEHSAQLMNYLRLTRMKMGLLVNFASYPKATVEQRVL